MAKIFKPTKKQVEAPRQLHIDRQSYDGRGIAHYRGQTVFVTGALPAETVSVQHFKAQRRYAECQAGNIVSASPERVSAPCEYYGRCGGCNLQHQNDEAQLAFKQRSVLEQMQRQAGLEPEALAPALVSAPWHYRSRARLGVDRQGRLAFRQRDSKAFVAIDHCRVLAAELRPFIDAIQALPQYAKVGGISHIELVYVEGAAAAVVRHTKALPEKVRTWLQGVASESGVSLWLQGERHGGLQDSTGEAVDPRLFYDLPAFDVRLGFHPADFTQVNTDINRQMVSQAIDWLQLQGSETVLDLFCGIGNFTLPLARRAAHVIGVEAIESMVQRGRENSEANLLTNCEFVAADLEQDDCEKAWNHRAIDAVLLDPPRAGAQQVAALLGRLQADKIVYVSCNPASLARDAKALADQGFRLARLGVMDMFPHTAHIESMALFTRS
ncbi:23S rRNA (uracil(1939)-C(5))-methyltransferase RlmD [Maricurvus nonylphenolicus]|uniref:23S rRNA (uracil(1939)-C(5))-methyltransferase RlmD n=1 Tax=Maricurvus nonylphenolicus TaxID=1008307 RepID=UPI0036F39E02